MAISTVQGLQRTAQTVAETAVSLAAKITTATANIDRSVEMNLGPPPMLASRRNEYDRAASQIRRSVVKESDHSRWNDLRAMSEAETEIIATESQFASPSMILARAGLGTPERSRYLEQIANAGPLEIQNFAAHAVATQNVVLGAALMSKLDSMPKKQRDLAGVSRAKLAEALAGEDFRAAQNAIRTIKVAVREALASNRSFESGRAVPVRDKVGIALSRLDRRAR